MKPFARWLCFGLLRVLVLAITLQGASPEEVYRDSTITGRPGGWLKTAQRTEPRTFNPVAATDAATRDILGRTHSDLIHINRGSLRMEPSLASSWSVSPNGRVYTVKVRRGIRFSDGHPMDADDVVFTFQIHLDEATGSAQRDLLLINGKPINVRKTGTHTVEFELPAPYASAERLFDSVPILPRHLLWKAYKDGNITRAWSIQTPPHEIAGLGPFRIKQYVQGQRVVLERNPYYWKQDRSGRRLPYLDGIVFEFLPNDEVHTFRFLGGDLSVISPVAAGNFMELKKREKAGKIKAYNAGSGLEYQFLVFNMNEADAQTPPASRARRAWFSRQVFRRAVSLAIDREAIARLVYHGLADPLWGHVTPGNREWRNRAIAPEARSISSARSLLASAGFSWNDRGLVDENGKVVEFSVLVSSTNVHRGKIATILQDDLRQLGMKVSVVSLEFRSMLDRVFNRLDYDAAVMALDGADGDPNSEMNVWLIGGSMHLWNMSGRAQAPWEKEIDSLMREQRVALDRSVRGKLYNRVQQLVAEHLPFISLTSPHVLVGAVSRLGNFQPSILRPNALWNADSIYFHEAQ